MMMMSSTGEVEKEVARRRRSNEGVGWGGREEEVDRGERTEEKKKGGV